MKYSKQIISLLVVILALTSLFLLHSEPYFPLWAKYSKNNSPILVLDTNSSLGRYSNYTKAIEG